MRYCGDFFVCPFVILCSRFLHLYMHICIAILIIPFCISIEMRSSAFFVYKTWNCMLFKTNICGNNILNNLQLVNVVKVYFSCEIWIQIVIISYENPFYTS